MTDEELIVRLRNLSANMFQSGNWGKDLDTTKAAADRIEQLLQKNENLHLLIDELTKTCETLVSERERLHKALLKERGINYE